MFEHSFTEPGETIVPKTASKNVNQPDHYNYGPHEVIDIIMDLRLDNAEGNVVKYIMRHKYKNGREDIEKAHRYLELIRDNYAHWYKKDRDINPRGEYDDRKDLILKYSMDMELNVYEANAFLNVAMHRWDVRKHEMIDDALEYISKILLNYDSWYEKEDLNES
jgi:hypothetical protein